MYIYMYIIKQTVTVAIWKHLDGKSTVEMDMIF